MASQTIDIPLIVRSNDQHQIKTNVTKFMRHHTYHVSPWKSGKRCRPHHNGMPTGCMFQDPLWQMGTTGF